MGKPTKTTQADVRFLFEMGQIRLIDRMWRRFHTEGFANLAEHHFRVFWIALVIAAQEGDVDTGKIGKMVMVHDIAESRTGDVDYIARQYVERNELLGIQDMLDGTSLKDEFFDLWQEYETRKSLEAKIVKDADTLDVDMELSEQAAQGNKVFRDAKTDLRKRDVRPLLFTEAAKMMFDEIIVANPHDWHLKGRNRHNAGDWKQK